MFDSCDLRKCVDVVIICDLLMEMNETFSVNLTQSDELMADSYLNSKIKLYPNNITVTIEQGMYNIILCNAWKSVLCYVCINK